MTSDNTAPFLARSAISTEKKNGGDRSTHNCITSESRNAVLVGDIYIISLYLYKD